ncbi:POT family-domain-containing protein [Paraphysoderma sedebokerense]|nr:POT family-domain-containing protein [Paraphysoderma sedebokerense]
MYRSRSDLEPESRKWKILPEGFPGSVFFIVGNEFCERFTFYGIKAILYIYLTSFLRFTADSSTALVHTFNMFAYFFPLLGGVLSDSYLGRFNTIVYLSLVYCLGNIILSVTAIPGVTGTPPSAWGVALGLGLLAVGTGGIKPCVSAFGGDQFRPDQRKEIGLFFSMFYFSINSGSVLSMIFTPVLRGDMKCFGRQDCFPIAFGVPSILMLIATFIFISGKKYYKVQPPSGNVLGSVVQIIKAAIANRKKYKKQVTNGTFVPDESDQPLAVDANGTLEENSAARTIAIKSWLDYALLEGKFDQSLVNDTKTLMNVLWIFLPLPAFWTLYDQQSSRWTSQALLMDPKLSVFNHTIQIKPDQMQVCNAILILLLIPFFQKLVYPTLESFRIFLKPHQKMVWGMAFTGISFLMAAFIQIWIDQGTFASPETFGLEYPNGNWRSGTLTIVNGLKVLVGKGNDGVEVRTDQLVCVENCVNILWQVPQYIVITVGEIMFSITGLEFAYSQAPTTMKSVCQAAWLLTTAIGNVLVIVIAESHFFNPMPEFVFFAGLIFVALAVFLYLSWGWRYVEDTEEDVSLGNEIDGLDENDNNNDGGDEEVVSSTSRHVDAARPRKLKKGKNEKVHGYDRLQNVDDGVYSVSSPV